MNVHPGCVIAAAKPPNQAATGVHVQELMCNNSDHPNSFAEKCGAHPPKPHWSIMIFCMLYCQVPPMVWGKPQGPLDSTLSTSLGLLLQLKHVALTSYFRY